MNTESGSGALLPEREDDCGDEPLPDLPESAYPPLAVVLDVDLSGPVPDEETTVSAGRAPGVAEGATE